MRQALITLSGLDRPGITANLLRSITRFQAQLCDIEQVVLQGQLTLCALIEWDDKVLSEKALRDALASMAQGDELHVRVQGLEAPLCISPTHSDLTYAITIIGETLCTHALAPITEALADARVNIDVLRRLSEKTLLSVEIIVSLPSPEILDRLTRRLVELSSETGVDIALQRENLSRRGKRLIAFDMDSTLVQVEVIDELARAHGVYEKVAALTRSSMEGQRDYEESLRERVALLKGMPLEKVMRVSSDLPLTPGAEAFIAVLHKLGFKAGIISGGFQFAVDALRRRLDLDFAYSNRLEVKDGSLSGVVIDPIVSPQRKADLLETVAQQEGVTLEQTIAVGDGANDVPMIERAGLGIAYHAKPRLRQAANTAINAGGLERILYLLGLREREVRELLSSSSTTI